MAEDLFDMVSVATPYPDRETLLAAIESGGTVQIDPERISLNEFDAIKPASERNLDLLTPDGRRSSALTLSSKGGVARVITAVTERVYTTNLPDTNTPVGLRLTVQYVDVYRSTEKKPHIHEQKIVSAEMGLEVVPES